MKLRRSMANVKLAIERIGWGYLAVLLCGFTLYFLGCAGWLSYTQVRPLDSSELGGWEGLTLVFFYALVHGIAAWGVLRHREWSRYLAMGFCMIWILTLGLAELVGDADSWGWWLLAVLLFIALLWLVLPLSRSQFLNLEQNK